MPEKMSNLKTSRSRSRSKSPRSVSRSPVKQHRSRSGSMNGRRTPDKRHRSRSKHSRDRCNRTKSRSISLKKDREDSPAYNSRSRSRSYTPYDRRRSPPRSPRGGRRHYGSREKPQQSRCIGIFGLNISTDEHIIREIFGKFGPIDRVQLVIDAKTGRSRGFCFVYFGTMSDAKTAKDACSGMEIDGRRIRVDYSITQRAHTPTPGKYMGMPTRYKEREYHDRYKDDYRRRRSPSPYRERRRRYERSRSRSYTPRRHRY